MEDDGSFEAVILDTLLFFPAASVFDWVACNNTVGFVLSVLEVISKECSTEIHKIIYNST